MMIRMLRIEADGLTLDDIAALRERHNIVDMPGFVTVLNARKVDNQIIWSTRRMKEGYWKTLQAREPMAAAMPVAA